MKINFKVRARNLMFWVSVVIAIFTPILAYMGLTLQDITTWAKLWEIVAQAFQNPYILVLILVSVYNAIIDPTTKGLGDSQRALEYNKPSGE